MNLTVLDANLWLFPFRISAHNMDRFEKFLGLAEKLNPDVITMQEVWSSSYAIMIREALQGYHIIASDKFLYNTGGLVTATKAVPTNSEIIYFSDGEKKGPIERLGKKGFHLQTFKMPDGTDEYDLVNTHTYNPEQKHEVQITEKQLYEISDACEGRNVIVAGDINLRAEQLARINKGPKKFQHQHLPTKVTPNIYQNRRANRGLRYVGNVDNILARSGSMIVRVEEARFITDPVISDHPALYAIVSLEKKS